MTYELLEIKIENHIATVALNRVDKFNALNDVLAKNIYGAMRELSENEEVRVIILKSNAKVFCAGIDLTAVAGRDRSNKTRMAFQDSFSALASCNMIEECKKPVIAAINGVCVGAGLDIACACDIRLCSEDARFSLKEAAMGLVADMGVLQRIPLIIGEGFAREMAFTAKFYSAKDAERMRLVNAVYPDVASLQAGAEKLAAEIAANAPVAVEETKETLNFSRNKPINDGMMQAKYKNTVLFASEDMQEAAAAFREKRKPEFKGR